MPKPTADQTEKQFTGFMLDIVTPILCRMQAEGTAYDKEPTVITARQVQDAYGLAAAECFKLLFKLLHRGGWSRLAGAGFKSRWVANPSALSILADWLEGDHDRSCLALKKHLIEQGVEQLVWAGQGNGWISVTLAKVIKATKNKKVAEAWLDYSNRAQLERDYEAATYH